MVEENNKIDSRRLSGNLSGAEAIIRRLKEALKAGSDGQLAADLGISRQNIGAARKRNDVPTGWIYKVAEQSGYSMDWLGFGRGPRKIRQAYIAPESDTPPQIASPPAAYRPLPAAGPEGSTKDRPGGGFGAAVEMLAKIYHSGDETMIQTITANIRAFCEILDRK